MQLTSSEALTLLESFRGKTTSDCWIEHCLAVGAVARKIAEALQQKGYAVDVDKVVTLGYVHDIGKSQSAPQSHEIKGYEFLQSQGYAAEYCNICLVHSYLNNDLTCTAVAVPDANQNLFLRNFIQEHNYTLEEKIIILSDLLCPQGKKVCTIDQRLIDIMLRKGVHANTQYYLKETDKLKKIL